MYVFYSTPQQHLLIIPSSLSLQVPTPSLFSFFFMGGTFSVSFAISLIFPTHLAPQKLHDILPPHHLGLVNGDRAISSSNKDKSAPSSKAHTLLLPKMTHDNSFNPADPLAIWLCCSSHQAKESTFFVLKSRLALWIALVNRMQQKWCTIPKEASVASAFAFWGAILLERSYMENWDMPPKNQNQDSRHVTGAMWSTGSLLSPAWISFFLNKKKRFYSSFLVPI